MPPLLLRAAASPSTCSHSRGAVAKTDMERTAARLAARGWGEVGCHGELVHAENARREGEKTSGQSGARTRYRYTCTMWKETAPPHRENRSNRFIDAWNNAENVQQPVQPQKPTVRSRYSRDLHEKKNVRELGATVTARHLQWK